MSRRLVGAALALGAGVLALGAADRRALAAEEDPQPVELEWIRLEGAEVCPPKRAFKEALEKRIGGAAFAAHADRVLSVTLSNENGPFRAVLSLKAKSATEAESKQELFSYSSKCDEVFSATVLSVALLLNPDEANRVEKPLEEQDSGFFEPFSRDTTEAGEESTSGLGLSSSSGSQDNTPAEAYSLPVAPQPWARRYGYVGLALVVALEQLPQSGTGMALRAEFPLDRRWLLSIEADWLGVQPIDADATGPVVGQSSGWLGAAWLPHETDLLELWVEGALGLSILQPSSREFAQNTARVHAALRLGLGVVFRASTNIGLTTMAAAVVPLAGERVGEWTQPSLGGQLQLGLLVGLPGPER